LHRNHNFLYTRVQKDLNAVPKDVKTLIFGMFVYTIAWGIIDPFMSIFIQSIVKSYLLTGFFYGLFFIIGAAFSVPIGGLADKINKIKFTVGSILFYPLIGLLYFSVPFLQAGLALIMLFFARLLHGFASLFWIVEEGFIRKHSPKGETSATFGLYITFYRMAFVVAPLFVIPIVLFFGLTMENVHWLLLSLIPFSILSGFTISRIADSGKPLVQGVREVIVKDKFVKKEFKDLRKMGIVGVFVLLVGFFMKSILSIIIFLIPLYALSLNFGIIEVSLLFAAINVPFLFSFFFAELADSFGKARLLSLGFAFSGIALLAISFSAAIPLVLFIACFVLGIILAIIQPTVNGLITDITPRVQDGEMTGIFTAVLKISGFASALALGLLADAFGLGFPFLVFALMLFAMAALTYSIKGRIVVKI